MSKQQYSRGTETVYMQRNRDCIYAEEQRLKHNMYTMALHQNVPTIVSAQVSRYIPYINSVLSNLMRNTI